MRILGFNITRQQPQQRDALAYPEETALLSLLTAASSSTGYAVTPLRACGIATVFACVNQRAKSLASLPLRLMQIAQDGTIREAREHRLWSALRFAPNEEMSAFNFWLTMEGWLALRGNAFAEILRDSDGDPVGLYPIEPDKIAPGRRDKKLVYRVNGAEVPPSRILHLWGLSSSGLGGLDPVTSLTEVFALAIAMQDNAAKFFGNGSRPSGVLEHPGALSKLAQERLRDQMESATGGAKTYRMMVLEEGLKYHATRSENKDSQFQEAREYQDLQICRVFGVPPHKVGIQNAQPRANVEQENISYATDTVSPECQLVESVLNLKLLSQTERDQGYEFKFGLDGLMRGDTKSRYQAYSLGRQWGWLSVNDIRRAENLSPVEGGDIYLQPVNMVKAGDEEDSADTEDSTESEDSLTKDRDES